MGYHRFVAKLSDSSLRCVARVYHFTNAVTTGFWLGFMSDRSLEMADDLHYKRSKKYFDEKYIQSGLFRWEKAAIEKYFSGAKKILLIAAGSARETFALSRMGLEVDSYECNEALMEYGNKLLQEKGFEERIKYLQRNTVPGELTKYEGIIIGWGAYSHIRGRSKRLSFLKDLRPFLKTEAPLMISFLLTVERTRQDRIVKRVSNGLRIFRRKSKTETGDLLHSGFVHYFTEEEIKNELKEAGYRITGYNSVDYGCIIATV